MPPSSCWTCSWAAAGYWHHFGVVIDPRAILRRYVTTWHMLPLNLAALAGVALSAPAAYAGPAWRRLPILLKLLQLPAISDEFLVQLRRGRKAENYSARKLRRLVGAMLLTSHFVVCGYGLAFGAAGDHAAAAVPPFQLTYAYGVWWTAGALSTLGTLGAAPREAGPLLFTTLVLMLALLTTVYVIGQLGVLISNLDASAVTYRKKYNDVDLFVRRQRLPDELAARVYSYLSLAWTRGAGQNLRDVVHRMNGSIRADIMHHICHSVVLAVPLFMGCEPKLIYLLMEVLIHEVYPQGEWVCHRGSIATCMYMILRGEVSVVVDEARLTAVAVLRRGDFFGERSLFGLEKRNASILAKTAVDLAMLSAEDFGNLLRQQPMLRESLEEAKQRREAEMEMARAVMQQQQQQQQAAERARGRRGGQRPAADRRRLRATVDRAHARQHHQRACPRVRADEQPLQRGGGRAERRALRRTVPRRRPTRRRRRSRQVRHARTMLRRSRSPARRAASNPFAPKGP